MTTILSSSARTKTFLFLVSAIHGEKLYFYAIMINFCLANTKFIYSGTYYDLLLPLVTSGATREYFRGEGLRNILHIYICIFYSNKKKFRVVGVVTPKFSPSGCAIAGHYLLYIYIYFIFIIY